MFTLFSLLILGTCSLHLAQSQIVASLPRCIQNCIDQSEDDDCSVTDIKCLCRASAGNFLPDLITCMHGNCDNNLDNNLLLTPLQFACEIAGVPIPDSSIQNAENAGISLTSQITKTVTVGASSSTGGGFGATTTLEVEPSHVSTVTVTTTEGGSIIAIIYPVTEWRTTTASGSRSTVTPVSTESSLSSGNSDSNSESTTIVATSLAAAKTSSHFASKTEKGPSPDETDSAPFTDTNSPAAKEKVGYCLVMTILLGMGNLWL